MYLNAEDLKKPHEKKIQLREIHQIQEVESTYGGTVGVLSYVYPPHPIDADYGMVDPVHLHGSKYLGMYTIPYYAILYNTIPYYTILYYTILEEVHSIRLFVE